MATPAPRYLVPALLIAANLLCLAVPLLRWGLVMVLPLLGLTFHDLIQRRHTLLRNYPLIARFRWFSEDLRPFVRSYFVESDHEGRPFSHQERGLVYARSKGDMDVHPMGTELNVYSDEYQWFGHSIRPNDNAPQEWRLDIGGPDCKQPYSSSLLNISAMSFGSLSARAIEALNQGAKLGNFAHDTGEGAISPYHRIHGGDLIWEIGSGYFGCRDTEGHFDPQRFADVAASEQVKMVEIKLSQGAKPGHGGMLPAAKVSREIAETRGVMPGRAVISPAAHSTFSTPIELLHWVAQLRELSGGKPVGMKLAVGQPHEVLALVKAMLETGITPDFMVIDGGEGGTGAAPLELTNSVGMPLREALILVRNALVGANLKSRIRIGASGKVHSAAGMADALGLGADWCNAARGFMFALGCIQAMKCHTGKCPTGITTQEKWRQMGLVVDSKAERVARFHRQTLHALREIVVAMGLDSPWQIKPIDMRERLNGAQSDEMDRIHSFLAPGQLLDEPEETYLARHWAMAQAESFRRLD
jgi:glutamate synthase domain-containing protein 2